MVETTNSSKKQSRLFVNIGKFLEKVEILVLSVSPEGMFLILAPPNQTFIKLFLRTSLEIATCLPLLVTCASAYDSLSCCLTLTACLT